MTPLDHHTVPDIAGHQRPAKSTHPLTWLLYQYKYLIHISRHMYTNSHQKSLRVIHPPIQ
jgi:hypothetical protein